MKGILEESFGFIIIILVVLILGIFYISGSTSSEMEILKMKAGNILDEEANNLILTLYDSKLGVFKKTYIEILIDASLQGYNKSQVYYGKDLGTLNAKELIISRFNKYFGEERWVLKVCTRKGNITYGGLKTDRLGYIYSHKIPVPPANEDKNINKIILYLLKQK